jgi:hypothetical protein
MSDDESVLESSFIIVAPLRISLSPGFSLIVSRVGQFLVKAEDQMMMRRQFDNDENKPKRPSPMTSDQEAKLLVLGIEF